MHLHCLTLTGGASSLKKRDTLRAVSLLPDPFMKLTGLHLKALHRSTLDLGLALGRPNALGVSLWLHKPLAGVSCFVQRASCCAIHQPVKSVVALAIQPLPWPLLGP